MDTLVNLLITLRLPVAAAIALSTLLRSGRPMALSELSEATGYAKGHLSTVLRLLEEKSLVERIRVSGRKLLFQARVEGLRTLLREHISELKAYLRSIAEELGDESLASVAKALEPELHAMLNRLNDEEV